MRKVTELFIATILALSFYTGCNDRDGGGGQGAPGSGAPAPAPVPQTGQTSCWNPDGNVIACAGTGQDGDIRAGVEWPDPRFTDNGDGTIRDNLTGLIWLKDANCFGSRTWAQALEDANTLHAGECDLNDGSLEGDWRLPNVLELASLFDFENSDPALPTGHPFMNVSTTQDSAYWSSTTYAFGPFGAWAGSFFFGFVVPTTTKKLVDDQFSILVLPVRGEVGGEAPAPVAQTGQTTCWDSDGNEMPCAGTGQDGDIQAGVEWPSPRFTEDVNGTITDNLTGLIWLQNANCFGERTWAQALEDANTLHAGECGLMDGSAEGNWHLPNSRELLSLLDFENAGLALPPGQPFMNIQIQTDPRSFYWSSTTRADPPVAAVGVEFQEGGDMPGFPKIDIDDASGFVLPVRGGS